MYDKIKCKIEFKVSSEEEARKIYDTICVGNEFNLQWISFVGDFDCHCGAVKRVENEDEEGKECFWKFVLYDRNYEIWYNEYISCEIGEVKLLRDKASFTFKALSSIPYQVVMSFADRFKVPFSIKGIDKTNGCCERVTYELDENERFRTKSTHACAKDDFSALFFKLMGYDPEEDEEEDYQFLYNFRL